MKKKLLIGASVLLTLFAFKNNDNLSSTSGLNASKSSQTLTKSVLAKHDAEEIAVYDGLTINTIDGAIPQPTMNFVPILRYYNAQVGKHFLTTDPNELGYSKYGLVYEKTIGWLRNANIPGYNVNRFLNNATGAHYYTLNSYAPSGFVFERIIGNTFVPPYIYQPDNIMEFYDPTTGDYCYTNDLAGENFTNYPVHNGTVFVAFTQSYD